MNVWHGRISYLNLINFKSFYFLSNVLYVCWKCIILVQLNIVEEFSNSSLIRTPLLKWKKVALWEGAIFPEGVHFNSILLSFYNFVKCFLYLEQSNIVEKLKGQITLFCNSRVLRVIWGKLLKLNSTTNRPNDWRNQII